MDLIMKDIKVIVAAHKKYRMPEDPMYLPLHVGREGKEDLGYTGDNTGSNISLKNPSYCELTGLYWAWKNLKNKYIGLAHYRRHFSLRTKNRKDKFANVLTGREASRLLKDCNIILPRRRYYFIENLYDHYAHTMYVEPLNITGEIIHEKYPEYLPYFNRLHKRTSAHMFNMFIMRRDILDGYCSWLFDILGELEQRVDASKYDSFHARFYGRISELLLDVYLEKNHLKYKEVGFIYMEKIDKVQKVKDFLLAKFTGRKYGKSF